MASNRGGAVKRGQPLLPLALALLVAGAIRSWRLDTPLFVVDEAESTINALTILQHGYPGDRYLEQPIFENTLFAPWPESREYEFRDSSYSERGLAIYHGWLPLYSIAASLKLFGIAPHAATGVLRVRRSDAEIRRLTTAARAPSVLFGVLFLGVLFVMARTLHGPQAAWAALLVAAFSDNAIDYARTARYYSLTALLSAACCLMAWRLVKPRRTIEFLLAGALLGCLFHTHVVAFLIACSFTAVIALVTLRAQRNWRHWLAAAAVTLVSTVPWAVSTGFLEHAPNVPRAFAHLVFPEDLLNLLGIRPAKAALLIAGLVGFAAAWLGRRVLPGRFVHPVERGLLAVCHLVAWLAATYVLFALLMPTVSYSVERVAMMLSGPSFVLFGIGVAIAAEIVAPRRPSLMTGALVTAYLAGFGTFDPLRDDRTRPPSREEVIEHLRGLDLDPATRLYATPNFHFVLAVYTGLPFQSVAPVRKSFLDMYPGPVLLVEVNPFRNPPAAQVHKAAAAVGHALGRDEAQRLAWRISGWAVRERAVLRAARVVVAEDAVAAPEFLLPLVADQQRFTAQWMRSSGSPAWDFPAVFRGYDVPDWSAWWPVFFYRYARPEERMGERLNWRERVRDATATVLPSGATVYLSPARPRTAG